MANANHGIVWATLNPSALSQLMVRPSNTAIANINNLPYPISLMGHYNTILTAMFRIVSKTLMRPINNQTYSGRLLTRNTDLNIFSIHFNKKS